LSAFQAAAATVPASGLLVCGLFGHIVMGILIVIGLGLGLVNTRLLQRSVVKVISSENPSRKAIGRSSAPRLLGIAAVALALGVFLKPDGFGVFLGLAAFQIIILATTVTPVMKERGK
jgi:hypothetical protein